MKCQRCTNEADRLWIRAESHLCDHCVDLDEDSGRARGRVRDGNPRNQPKPIKTSGGPAKCVWCPSFCYPTYAWRGKIIHACGWGHAGLWMDAQMEAEMEEPIDEDYVRRSLGMV